MKFPWKISLAMLALIVFALAACRKDSIDVDVNNQYPDPSIRIETQAMGVVLDNQGNPVSNAVVTMGTDQTLTNEDGIFILKGLTPKIQPFVRVEKTGYFPSLVSFSSKAGDTGRLTAVLKPKQLAGSLNATSGGVAQLSDGSKITFEANGFKSANGDAYTGTVNVYASYIDPSDPDHAQRVPGAFRGLDANNAAALLHSFGMMKVLLETPGGEQLQISKSAEMVFPIPSDRIGQAPATIPLWYIDEATSLWMEEGEAVLVGNTYVGMVNHFSWWNCDLNVPLVNLKGMIEVNGGHPFSRVTLKFSGWEVTTTTSESGLFEGPIPANHTFTLWVLDDCGEEVFTGSYGPYGSDLDLGTLTVTSSAYFISVSGKLLDCNGDPVSNGLAIFSTGSFQNIPLSVDPVTGEFAGSIVACTSNDITLICFDIDSKKSSQPISQTYAPSLDFGNVQVCNQLSFGVTIEYNGITKYLPVTFVELREDSIGEEGIYIFNYVDDQGNGNLINYASWIANYGTPGNANWIIETTVSISGNPTSYISFYGEVDILSSTLGTQPGELVHFEFANGLVLEQPGNIEYPMATAKFTAILP